MQFFATSSNYLFSLPKSECQKRLANHICKIKLNPECLQICESQETCHQGVNKQTSRCRGTHHHKGHARHLANETISHLVCHGRAYN
ncbi:hypothetical protein FR483_n486L [Paramecium bursaria Chlorella virus FR483]|uniref:Uncharacterized protein n486L n=1 Tax=Paramecium bursaria Chlorella virus FR483 TaxID=399781 RepID=A7J7J0_PBCVF|nr:hypothetical protein FR483_n486L [Paramecium bursaria Chlorella virus FR483]ABT15771.1 hypothetical protein FR483_n486L [Paramecium bursaria Chlorella virus FR483]